MTKCGIDVKRKGVIFHLAVVMITSDSLYFSFSSMQKEIYVVPAQKSMHVLDKDRYLYAKMYASPRRSEMRGRIGINLSVGARAQEHPYSRESRVASDEELACDVQSINQSIPSPLFWISTK